MFIKVGSQVSVSDPLHGIIIQSGNDASVALAEHIAGSEDAFADMMNTTAQKLGLTNSHFMDATGLPNPDHYSSARDMAVLARAIIYGEPSHYAIYAQKEFLWNNIKQPNRNLLLWRDKTVDGLKTGHRRSRLLPGGFRGTRRPAHDRRCSAPTASRPAPPRPRSC